MPPPPRCHRVRILTILLNEIMRNQCAFYRFPLLLLLLLHLFFILACNGGFAEAKIHIPDDLDDVIDDEEDEAWKEWGKKSAPPPAFDPPPVDFSGMSPDQIQEEMMKRQTGPSFGFVKLRFGVRRTPDMVSDIAMKWTKVLRTGALETKFMVVDLSTIMFTMVKGQDSRELKGFILDQPEAYEIKIGDQAFRRPGDPPLEEVLERLQNENNEADNSSPSGDESHLKDEL